MFFLKNYFNIGVSPIVLNISSNTQYLECFLIGVLFSFVNFKKEGVVNKKIIAVLWLLVVVMMLLISKSGGALSGNEYFYQLRYFSLFYAAVFGLTLVYISNNFSGFFSNRFLVYTGRIGFSLYLLHLPVISLVNKIFTHNYQTFNFFISMLFVYFIARYTFKYIELPFINYAAGK